MEGKYAQAKELLGLFERSDFTAMLVEFDGLKLSVSKVDSAVDVTWNEALAVPLAERNQVLTAVEPTASAALTQRPSEVAVETTPKPADEPVTPEEGWHVVRAPMLGTFYRSPAPDEPPFVSEGQKVSASDTLCLIECMKLFNTLPAGVSGQVMKFLADNGSLVEFDQPIAYIFPD